MAKDPAMLWYWSDWNSGTVLMSRFLKGCYMDLLHAQFNHGRLSLEEIKVCLGSDFGTSWPALQKKFEQDEKGLFFNERLEFEKNKRKEFSNSRRDNINKRYSKATYVDTSVEHMNIHMENENINSVLEQNTINSLNTKERHFNQFPTYEGCKIDLTGNERSKAFEIYYSRHRTMATDEQINDLFKLFKLQSFDGSKFYQNEAAIFQHFRNWIPTQRISHIQQTNGKISINNYV